MIPFDEVEALVGHAPGGVCPFGINEGIEVYLDESLKMHRITYPGSMFVKNDIISTCL